MPGGSVVSKVVWVRLGGGEQVERIFCSSHIPTLDALEVFVDKRDRVLVFEMENGVELTVTPTLDVRFDSASSLQSFKINSAILWRMKDEGFPSRRDDVSSERWSSAKDSPDELIQVFKDFSKAQIRCKLHLEGIGGPEIDIYPSLKPDVPAFGEPSFVSKTENMPSWDIYIELWPMLEEWLGIKNGAVRN